MRTYKILPSFEKDTNNIFLFGANTQYRHGLGAAKWAMQFGAKYGNGGLQGNTYCIITKDLTVPKHMQLKSVSLEFIKKEIIKFYIFADTHKDLDFYVCYRADTKNLNGYTPEEIAKCFNCKYIPDNVYFQYEFSKLIL